jgi:GTP pyrophosphokinase
VKGTEFDYCCNPKRGDDIIGFRSGHNVIVHHKLCERAGKLMEAKTPMMFVKWTRNAPSRYEIILNLENKRGSLAEFLTYLSKLGVDLVKITLNESDEADDAADFFEIIVELGENLDSGVIHARLAEKYNIVEFKSLNDAYKENRW